MLLTSYMPGDARLVVAEHDIPRLLRASCPQALDIPTVYAKARQAFVTRFASGPHSLLPSGRQAEVEEALVLARSHEISEVVIPHKH
jgi:hypothetical protein